MALAYSYYRFSSKKQEDGDSLRRQTQYAENFAQKHGLTLATTRYYDPGMSAYRGKNKDEGALSVFIAAAKAGEIPKGSYLIVESFDRVSRQNVMDAYDTFRELLKCGIHLVTTIDDQIYREEDLNENWTKLIQVLAYMARANDESNTKSNRGIDWWQARRKQIDKGVKLTSVCPAWLKLSEDKQHWELIPERVELVQRIFQMADDGLGSPRIAKTLAREGVYTMASMNFGKKRIRCKSEICKKSDEPRWIEVEYSYGLTEVACEHCDTPTRVVTDWSPELVNALLRNTSVLGVYTPKKAKNAEEVHGYYPAIIELDQFERVQQAIAARRHTGGPSHYKAKNIFAGLLRCECGSKMRLASKNNGQSYVQCRVSYGGSGQCYSPRHPYRAIEETVLPFLTDVFPEPKKIAPPNPTTELKLQLYEKERKRDRLVDALASLEESEGITQRIALLEKEIKALRAKIQSYVPPASMNTVVAAVNSVLTEYLALRKSDIAETLTEEERVRYEDIKQTIQLRVRQMLREIVIYQDTHDAGSYEYRFLSLYGPYVDEYITELEAMGEDLSNLKTEDGGIVLDCELPPFGINGTRRRLKQAA